MLHDALLAVKIRIMGEGETPVKDNSTCAPINWVIGSIFSDCKIYLNDVAITTSSSAFNYKNYIETTLNYNSDVKSSWLQSGGYFVDTYNMFDDMTTNNV